MRFVLSFAVYVYDRKRNDIVNIVIMLSVMNDLPDVQQQPPVSPAHSTGTITRRFSKGFQSCLKGTRDDFDVDIDQGKKPSPSWYGYCGYNSSWLLVTLSKIKISPRPMFKQTKKWNRILFFKNFVYNLFKKKKIYSLKRLHSIGPRIFFVVNFFFIVSETSLSPPIKAFRFKLYYRQHRLLYSIYLYIST